MQHCYNLISPKVFCRSHWPRGLMRGSEAARLLGLRVRIPRGHGWLSVVSVACCQVEVCASDLSLVQRSPTECGVSECDHESPIMRNPWPTGGCRAMVKKKLFYMFRAMKVHHQEVSCRIQAYGIMLCPSVWCCGESLLYVIYRMEHILIVILTYKSVVFYCKTSFVFVITQRDESE
jgi:hypothetical protein